MSRASGASFAQFFPTAPRAAKDKAKERESKAKFQHSESPSIPPVADAQANATAFARNDYIAAVPPAENNIPHQDPAPLPADDNDSQQGDILNVVGSASSHSSNGSSLFSAPGHQSNMSTSGGSRSFSSLTPLTNHTDSSPAHIGSPSHAKAVASAPSASGFIVEKSSPPHDFAPAQPATAEQPQILCEPRVHARDPIRGVKGMKCTYDPQLDRKLSSLSSNDKKKGKPIYKEFGIVCIQSAGSVILLV